VRQGPAHCAKFDTNSYFLAVIYCALIGQYFSECDIGPPNIHAHNSITLYYFNSLASLVRNIKAAVLFLTTSFQLYFREK
jgi:hypothetical protein